MKQQHLTFLAASMLAFPLASHAEVTIYGFLSAAIESVKATAPAGQPDLKSMTRINDQNSRIGFKGSEDLGNGLNSVWKIESSLKNFENGGTSEIGQSATLGTRNTYVGLHSAQFGQVLLGNIDSASKIYAGQALLPEPFQNTTAGFSGAPSNILFRSNSRMKNSVAYDSPEFAGFKFGGTYGFDEVEANDSTGNSTDRSHISIGGNYSYKGLLAFASFDRVRDSAIVPTTQTFQGYKTTAKSGTNIDYTDLGAMYSFPTGTWLFGSYEWGKFGGLNNASYRQDAYGVAIGQDIGAATVYAGYAKLGKLNGATVGSPDDYKAHQWTLAGIYNLSKRTQLYAYATKVSNGIRQSAIPGSTIDEDGIFNNGAANANTTSTALLSGYNPQAIGMGMKVSF